MSFEAVKIKILKLYFKNLFLGKFLHEERFQQLIFFSNKLTQFICLLQKMSKEDNYFKLFYNFSFLENISIIIVR